MNSDCVCMWWCVYFVCLIEHTIVWVTNESVYLCSKNCFGYTTTKFSYCNCEHNAQIHLNEMSVCLDFIYRQMWQPFFNYSFQSIRLQFFYMLSILAIQNKSLSYKLMDSQDYRFNHFWNWQKKSEKFLFNWLYVTPSFMLQNKKYLDSYFDDYYE